MKLISTIAAALFALATIGCDKAGQTGPLDLNEDQQAAPAPSPVLDPRASDIAAIKAVVVPPPLSPEQKAVLEAKKAADQASRNLLEAEVKAAKASADAALAKAKLDSTPANIAAARKAVREAIAAQRRVETQADVVLANATSSFSTATTAKEMETALASLGSLPTGRSKANATPAKPEQSAEATANTAAPQAAPVTMTDGDRRDAARSIYFNHR